MISGALSLLTFFSAASLLVFQALEDTTRQLLDNAPDVVVRRLNAGGWAPIPIKDAMAAVSEIPGVIDPRPRLWGTVSSSQGPLTILAIDSSMTRRIKGKHLPVPGRGQIIVGNGVRRRLKGDGKDLTLASARSRTFRIIATLPDTVDMAAFDLVLADAEDTRYLLDIPKEMASDVALNVFHSNEARVLREELAEGFPWPVHVALKEEAQKNAAGAFALKGGLQISIFTPGILALILLISAGGNDVLARRSEVGLLRTLGWTGYDLFRMQLFRAVFTCVPSVTMGIAVAYAAVFSPGGQWVGRLLLGWSRTAPAYYLSSMGAGLILMELSALLVIPYILASLWPVLFLAAQDPLTQLKGE